MSDFLSSHQFGIGAHLDAIGGFVPARLGDVDKRVEPQLVNLPRQLFGAFPFAERTDLQDEAVERFRPRVVAG